MDLVRRHRVPVCLTLVGVYVAAAIVVGDRVLRPLSVSLDASPFVGAWDWHLGWRFLLPGAVAAVIVVAGPRWASSVRWVTLVVSSAAGAVVWATALAATDGWDRVTAPLSTQYEYEPFAATIDGSGAFLRTFVDRLGDYPVHVQGHPPGAVLVPWTLDGLGLSGAGWFAALVILGWGVAAAATLVAVRSVSGEAAARRAAPALVLLPGAVWAATSADALFSGVLATGVAVAVLGRRRHALLGGMILGGALLLTYGGVLVAAVPAVLHLWHRRVAHVVALGVGGLVVLVGVWVASGFWWLDGLAATRDQYWAGVASARPGIYLTLLGNPAMLAVSVGPATIAGLAGVWATRSWRTVVIPLLALGAVALADLSQLSRGEVERIWLPFAVLIGAAAVGDRRRWLAAQAGVGLMVQAVLVSPW